MPASQLEAMIIRGFAASTAGHDAAQRRPLRLHASSGYARNRELLQHRFVSRIDTAAVQHIRSFAADEATRW